MSTPSIAERVAAGVVWLDANVPDWVERIDLERLDVALCTRCVLGQLFGVYSNSPLVDRSRNAPPLGFLVYEGHGGRAIAEYAALQAEWRRVIEERRQAAGEPS